MKEEYREQRGLPWIETLVHMFAMAPATSSGRRRSRLRPSRHLRLAWERTARSSASSTPCCSGRSRTATPIGSCRCTGGAAECGRGRRAGATCSSAITCSRSRRRPPGAAPRSTSRAGTRRNTCRHSPCRRSVEGVFHGVRREAALRPRVRPRRGSRERPRRRHPRPRHLAARVQRQSLRPWIDGVAGRSAAHDCGHHAGRV